MKLIKQINFFVIVLISHLLISTSGAVAQTYAYGIRSGIDNITITSAGTITLLTTEDTSNAYGIYSDGTDNTIINSGTITISTEGRLISRVQLFEDLLLKVQKRRRKGGK